MTEANIQSLIKYDFNLIGKGKGFINKGATCYLNSLLQCILSCSSIYEVLKNKKNEPHIAKNKFAMELLNLFELSQDDSAEIYNKTEKIWNYILTISQSQLSNVKMDTGQQDVHEGFCMFLEAFKSIPEIKRLFNHRHKIEIYCNSCNKIVLQKYEINCVLEVQPDLKSEQMHKSNNTQQTDLNNFIIYQNSFTENYKCGNCGSIDNKAKSTTLTMVPEIIPILFKKYDRKILTNFPRHIYFTSIDKKYKLVYQLVAQSEHSGTISGGHYWAICLRKDGWKYLNDGSVSNIEQKPTESSYFIFYHFKERLELIH
jgi:hypothetical protein